MKLSEIFTQLAYGELSQLNLGSHTDGIVTPANHPQLMAHINLGMAALYKRFLLKEGQLTVTLQSGRLTYPLLKKYAVSTLDSYEQDRFITDSESDPFLGDINKIEQVLTEYPYEMALNDASNDYSCYTPTPTTLKVPAEVVAKDSSLSEKLITDTLTVVYRAAHATIAYDPDDFEPDEIEVELPFSHLEALLYFVASRVNNPIGLSNEFHAGNSWMQKYEMECSRLEQFNLQIDQSSRSTRFEEAGWV